jgi:epoxyqueuosine reductase
MSGSQRQRGGFERELEQEARRLGFDAFGIADARAPWPAQARLAEFLAHGRHGDMTWMDSERRGHPLALWPEARSALMLGLNYGPDVDPLDVLAERDRGALSVYAVRRDYHDLVKSALKALARFLADRTGADVKVFVDTAPLMEKPLAQRAGIGWQGKHTNLVSRTHGSWLFLGAILTDAALPPDAPEEDHCGSCRACLDICPTAAFPAPYQLDARRCLAYLSIESRQPIPLEFRAAMGNRIFGCDDCLAVCPWNKFASTAQDGRVAAREALQGRPLSELATLDDAAFRALFAGTPVKRTGRDGFVRNVLVAIGNSANPSLAAVAAARLDDESPLVRGAAVWALAKLDPEQFAALKVARADAETDPDVGEEWRSIDAADRP